MKRVPLSALALLAVMAGCDQKEMNPPEKYSVIPKPVELVMGSGSFVIDDKTKLTITPSDESTAPVTAFLAEMIRRSADVPLPVEEGSGRGRNRIFMAVDSSLAIGREGYTLMVTGKRVELRSPSPAGLFRGVQTLRQLMPPQVEVEGGLTGEVLPQVPACFITDEPRFSYRGMHLDVCRHFFTVDEVKRYLDILALHKFNTFHWHLTDDQGWRIEIKKYPELTATGSQRKETLTGHGGRPPFTYDGKPHGGYYSQEEAREIVRYAAERYITVIPEIEMPGHAVAALASYPWLSCTGNKIEVQTRWGVMEDVFCAGRDTVFAFLEGVLDEVMEIFPSEYIHIGGDECPKTRWEKCSACQQRIREESLSDEHELQSWFITRIEKYLNSHGRKIIGWDEILEGGLAPDATVMSWRGIRGGIEAARMGHDAIMTPTTHAYLDYYQGEPAGEPLAIGGYLPLERVYSFEPLPDELNADEQKHILGLQGNLWTEYISTMSYLEYMTFPRAFAIAETAWTPYLKKDFEEFLARLDVLKERYDLMHVNYFRGEYRDTRGRTE
ncbi:MAG: beta-N-acetylhexosaminidase [Bacteroidales bacterium]|jgi:hexosaminidase|nr:beta-N-acetylhexosaminidase [Bacteroidales bacterium]MCB9027607.1 beta-N-acetylhexosaminidase [Bacteroidales bacterium]NLD63898.1 beta-N-acetylhexosaminidase [Bacteroidales bacterium]HNT93463.1 beta-N-acetylhexosaminidase [Bacteroidales bacterium]HOO65420.1 beta-N-acetylhexosaminidase [Bacteroidales bacterium]